MSDGAMLHEKAVVTREAANGWLALAITLAIQVYASAASTAPAVLAPEIARSFSLRPALTGVFVGIISAGAMAASLVVGAVIERYGPIRASQLGVLLCSGGIGIVAVVPATMPILLPLGAILIGLGYAPITPASSDLLIRTTPPGRMTVTFSLKQSGVPGGAALAAATLPALALAVGWRAAAAVLALGGLCIAALAQPTRRALDGQRSAATRFSWGGLLTPVRLVFSNRKLRELTVVGVIYVSTQVCVSTFLVLYLKESLGLSLVAAGLALTVVNSGGIVGRIVWGGVADCLLAPKRLFGGLGVVSGACVFLILGFFPGWPPLARLFVCAVFGMTAIGWTGILLSELAREAAPGQTAVTTAGCGFFLTAGLMASPPAFSLVTGLTGSYRPGFWILGVVSLVSGAWLFFRAE